MKKLTKISLHNLSQAELAKKEENLLRGGEFRCACAGSSCVCVNDYVPGTLEYWEHHTTISLQESNFNKDITKANYENSY